MIDTIERVVRDLEAKRAEITKVIEAIKWSYVEAPEEINCHPKPASLRAAIRDLLTDAAFIEPFTVKDVKDGLREVMQMKAKPQSVAAEVYYLARTGYINRVNKGVYVYKGGAK